MCGTEHTSSKKTGPPGPRVYYVIMVEVVIKFKSYGRRSISKFLWVLLYYDGP